jgi:hypothetical protein
MSTNQPGSMSRREFVVGPANNQTPRVEASPGYVDVTVPTILVHEVVAIDL